MAGLANLIVDLDAIRYKELAADTIGQVAFDSLRTRQLEVNGRLIAANTVSNIIFQLWIYPMIAKKYGKDLSTTSDLEYAGLKALNSTVMNMLTARIFGGKIDLMNSLINSVGAEGLSFLAGRYLLKGDSAGPVIVQTS